MLAEKMIDRIHLHGKLNDPREFRHAGGVEKAAH